jgi:hypothetical protein
MTQISHLVVVCPDCGGTGAVANVALHQARELARYFRVTLVSDSFPAAELAGVAFHRLSPPRLVWTTRRQHWPNRGGA